MVDKFLNTDYQEFLNDQQFCENWLVNNQGECQPYFPNFEQEFAEPYRLYRFLTDLENILNMDIDQEGRINAIILSVRQLLTSADWLHTNYAKPNPQTGWSITSIYQEPNYPITLQTVAWNPGNVSPVHNHASWGVVAIISGEEKNTFWRRSLDNSTKLEKTSEKVLVAGDIVGFTPDAIHCVEPLGQEPCITFNLYGEADYSQRYEFDIIRHTAKNF